MSDLAADVAISYRLSASALALSVICFSRSISV